MLVGRLGVPGTPLIYQEFLQYTSNSCNTILYVILSLSLYVYVYMYICICMYIYIYIYIYIYVKIHIRPAPGAGGPQRAEVPGLSAFVGG